MIKKFFLSLITVLWLAFMWGTDSYKSAYILVSIISLIGVLKTNHRNELKGVWFISTLLSAFCVLANYKIVGLYIEKTNLSIPSSIVKGILYLLIISIGATVFRNVILLAAQYLDNKKTVKKKCNIEKMQNCFLCCLVSLQL